MSDPSSPRGLRYDLADEAHQYPAWSGPPRRSVLICTHPRSGSTMLGEALYFAGGLGCPLELIHAGSRAGFERQLGVTGLARMIRAAWHRRTDPGGTFAAKLFWRDIADLVDEAGGFPDLHTTPADQIAPDVYRRLAALLQDLFPGAVSIHLERRDRLRQAISSVTATQTDVWRAIPGVETRAPAHPVVYDHDAICALMATGVFCHDHWRGFFRANGIRAHCVVYEDMVSDYDCVVGRLLRDLGHRGDVPPLRMERQSTAQNEALIRRFLLDQRQALRG